MLSTCVLHLIERFRPTVCFCNLVYSSYRFAGNNGISHPDDEIVIRHDGIEDRVSCGFSLNFAGGNFGKYLPDIAQRFSQYEEFVDAVNHPFPQQPFDTRQLVPEMMCKMKKPDADRHPRISHIVIR